MNYFNRLVRVQKKKKKELNLVYWHLLDRKLKSSVLFCHQADPHLTNWKDVFCLSLMVGVVEIGPTLLLLPLFTPRPSWKHSEPKLNRIIIKRLCLVLCGLCIFSSPRGSALIEKERDLWSQREGHWHLSESHLLRPL